MPNILIEGKGVERVDHVMLLDITLYNDLTWKRHVDNIVKKAAKIMYKKYYATSRIPVEGKALVCLICVRYRIIILVIIIISLGQILLSYIENTSRTHARTRAHAHIHARKHIYTHTAEPFRLALCDGSVRPNRDGPFRWRQSASLLHSNKNTRGRSGFPRFCGVFCV